MQELNFESRLFDWSRFRKKLETSTKPFQDAISYYDRHERCKLSIDPWDRATWPGPWEILLQNKICDLTHSLAVCYTLQLTERFSKNRFEIHIITEVEKQETFMLLSIGQTFIQPMGKSIIQHNEAPGSWVPQKVYPMPALH